MEALAGARAETTQAEAPAEAQAEPPAAGEAGEQARPALETATPAIRRFSQAPIARPVAAQDIWEFLGCICNMPEIAEESGMTGGSAKVALQD